MTGMQVDETNKSLFGLPEVVEYCDTCVYTNQKPNSTVEFRAYRSDKKTGLRFQGATCISCLYSEAKDTDIDWEARRLKLAKLCDKFRSRNGSYDCIVPGSGGKDSFYAALVLKHEFHMNPLTVTWAPHIYTEWGWRNFKRWIDAGLPNYLYHPNGAVHRFLSRLSLESMLHPFQPFILGQYGFPLRCAETFNIPLIFYGENSAEYGNAIEDNDNPNRRLDDICRIDNEELYISGYSESELVEEFGLKRSDLSAYLPPAEEKVLASNTEWHYLGYYLKWHPQKNYYFSVGHGFDPAPERNAGSYSRYTSLDDKLDDFNFYCMHIKYGIGRATYDAAQEIKRGDITRKEAVALINRFDGEFPERFKDDLYSYWSMDKLHTLPAKALMAFDSKRMTHDYFVHLCDTFRSPHLWHRGQDNSWHLKKQLYS